MTSEEFQRHVRIAFYVIGGNLMGSGWTNGTQGQLYLSIAMVAATFVWSLFGNRIAAKVAEMRKIADDPTTSVKGVITDNTVEGRALADSVPGNKVAAAGTIDATNIARS